MAAVDPYSPCPCGSGQKYKWCCQKVEDQAERAQRLFENGQHELALKVVAEGLRKEPGNALLLMRQALYQLRMNQPEPAEQSLRRVLEKNPKHFGARVLLTRLVLETEGPAAGASEFQQALSVAGPEDRPHLAGLARLVGVGLSESAHFAAALKHLELAPKLAGKDESTLSSQRTLEGNPAISLWLKNPYAPAPAPGGLDGPARERFDEALRWVEDGLWSAAASAFDLLSADPAAAREAEYNLGLCRLWLADDAGAVEALRRSIARVGATTEAVDLEALCQQIDPPRPDDQVEQVQLIWPLRSREALLQALGADTNIEKGGTGPIDHGDPDSPKVDRFLLLDRPRLERTVDLRVDDMPWVVGQVLVGQEIVALEAFDDGRLNGLIDRFTALAGEAITPAHPRTKVLGTAERSSLALAWEWQIPEGLDPKEASRLDRQMEARVIHDVWPDTPMPYLGHRTPRQAAQAGDAEVPLRAAIFQFERARDGMQHLIDFPVLRAALNLPPEPSIDPNTVEIDRLHLARLALVPVEPLDDDRLVALYRLGRRMMIPVVLERAVRVLINRPELWERAGLESVSLYTDMVLLTARRGEMKEAFEWQRRGMQADPVAKRAAHAPHWDMLEIRLRAMSTSPAVWVPELALVLERYGHNQEANTVIVYSLLEMGLLRLVPNPDRPDDLMLDSRPLQVLLAEYGPRVTTASGPLGASASQGGIWTPASEMGSGKAIWTPGSDVGSPSGGTKPKLIIPGR